MPDPATASEPAAEARREPAPRATRLAVGSWIMYDLANTLFLFVVLSFYFGPWLVTEWNTPDSAITVSQSLSMLVVLVLAPILGAATDKTRRMPFLVASTIVAVTATCFLGLGAALGLGASHVVATAVGFFVVANIGFQMGLVFYDALLPSVSTPANVGRVGALGVSFGYMGSFIGLGLANLVLDLSPTAEPELFFITGLLFLYFALPCFFFVPERRTGAILPRGLFVASARSAWRTVRALPTTPSVGRFLLARILYADAINTFILVLGIYAVQTIGFNSESLEYSILLLIGIVASIIGAPVWGLFVDRYGAKPTLLAVLSVWIFTLALVIAHPLLGLPREYFLLIAPLAGICIGGTWAADRPLMLALAPPDRVGEYYGLYAMAGRFAAIVGPVLWGLIVDVLFHGKPYARPIAVAFLALFIVASIIVLRPLKVPPRADGGNAAAVAPVQKPSLAP